MKQIIIYFLLIVCTSSFGQTSPKASNKARTNQTTSSKVYICNSNSAYAYHSSDGCSGLNRCTHGISGISKITAEGKNRKPCKKCY